MKTAFSKLTSENQSMFEIINISSHPTEGFIETTQMFLLCRKLNGEQQEIEHSSSGIVPALYHVSALIYLIQPPALNIN